MAVVKDIVSLFWGQNVSRHYFCGTVKHAQGLRRIGSQGVTKVRANARRSDISNSKHGCSATLIAAQRSASYEVLNDEWFLIKKFERKKQTELVY